MTLTATPSILRNVTTAKIPIHGQPWRLLLTYDRALTDQAISRAGLRPAPSGKGWLYPFRVGDRTYERFKAFPGQHGPKYAWYKNGRPGHKPADVTFYDPAGDLAEHVAAAGGVLILASGEADVWACWSAGVYNVTCTLHGEGTIPDWLIERLRALAVRTVKLWPDCDTAGLNHARKVTAALQGSGIIVEVYALPFDPGSKGDLNTLLLKVGPDGFQAALDSCPPAELPEVENLKKPEFSPRAAPPNDLYERWCLEVEAAAIRTWNIHPANGKNLSRRNFSSPLREDRNPSAQWNYTAHGFKDYATGAFYNTATCADLLGLPTWEEFKRQHTPNITRSNATLQNQSASHYANGFPWTLTRFLLTVKDKTVDRQDLADLATIELLHTLCAMPDVLTVLDFKRRAEACGWKIDRRKVASVFRWGIEAHLYNFEPIDSKQDQTIGSNLIKCPIRFKPVHERLAALGDYLAPRMAAPRRAPATASEIAGVLGELPAGLEGLDAARADVVAAGNQDRAEHQRRAARWLAVWQGSVKHILDGSYQPISLEPQPLSGPKLRVALARQIISEGVEVRRVVAQTGLSKTTVLKLAREADLESVPQTATIPTDQVTPTMRARGLVMSENSDMATIHTPNVFKRRDTLTDEEQHAVKDQQDQQSRRALAHVQRPTTALEAAQRRKDLHNRRADDKAAAVRAGILVHTVPKKPRRDPLDVWLDFQWNLSPPLAAPPFDPETGELLAGRARWHAAFELARGNTMTTFTAYSEPRESDPPAVDREPVESHDPPDIKRPIRVRVRRPVDTTPIKPRPDPYWNAFDRMVAVMEGEAAR